MRQPKLKIEKLINKAKYAQQCIASEEFDRRFVRVVSDVEDLRDEASASARNLLTTIKQSAETFDKLTGDVQADRRIRDEKIEDMNNAYDYLQDRQDEIDDVISELRNMSVMIEEAQSALAAVRLGCKKYNAARSIYDAPKIKKAVRK